MKPEEEEWFENPGHYQILMDGRWELADLSAVPHIFEQCYSFIYCFDAAVQPIDSERVAIALRGYPWRGGFSYLNIYSVLRNQIAWRDKPRIREVRYASPGWINLALNPDVAIAVAKAVAALAASAAVAAKSYAAAHKALITVKEEREKSKLTMLRLTVEQDAVLIKLCNSHAKFLGFKSTKFLIDQTGNSEVALRLILAHHRRIKDLGKYIEDGKVRLPLDESGETFAPSEGDLEE